MSKIVLNEQTGQEELHIEGMLLSIHENVLVNSNGTEYRIGDVSIEYPNGDNEIVSAAIWEKNIEKNLFKPDMKIKLIVQIEGEYAGYSRVQLAGVRRVDVSKILLTRNTRGVGVNKNDESSTEAVMA